MTVTRYPLCWPSGWRRSKQRERARFSTKRNSMTLATGYRESKSLTVSDGVSRILVELRAFGVREGDSIISTNVEVRLDGLPRSGEKAPLDPGVAVYWQVRGQPMKVMAIDQYDRVADNLAAVAATLAAMRAIERHGGAQILERAFTGFDALPAPDSCWDILGVSPGASADAIRSAYVKKARECHPDTGGSHDFMVRLNAARDEALRQSAA